MCSCVSAWVVCVSAFWLQAAASVDFTSEIAVSNAVEVPGAGPCVMGAQFDAEAVTAEAPKPLSADEQRQKDETKIIRKIHQAIRCMCLQCACSVPAVCLLHGACVVPADFCSTFQIEKLKQRVAAGEKLQQNQSVKILSEGIHWQAVLIVRAQSEQCALCGPDIHKYCAAGEGLSAAGRRLFEALAEAEVDGKQYVSVFSTWAEEAHLLPVTANQANK